MQKGYLLYHTKRRYPLIKTVDSNIESKLTHETWMVGKKQWNYLPGVADIANKYWGGWGVPKVWTGEARKERGFLL